GVGVDPGNQGLLATNTWLGSGFLSTALNVFDNPSPGTPATVSGASACSALFGVNPLTIENFVVYYSAQMKVTQAGAYTFGSGQLGLPGADAAGAVYVDANKNHIFEDSNSE